MDPSPIFQTPGIQAPSPAFGSPSARSLRFLAAAK